MCLILLLILIFYNCLFLTTAQAYANLATKPQPRSYVMHVSREETIKVLEWALKVNGFEPESGLNKNVVMEITEAGKIVLCGADLQNREFQGMNLRNADFSKVNFQNAKLQGASFSGSNLDQAQLCKATLSGTDFSFAKLVCTDFANAYAYNANFSYACLRFAKFDESNLASASLESTDLCAASFKETKLAYARLDYANLLETCFEGADLHSASLIGVKNLKPAQLAKAKNLEHAILDAGRFADAVAAGYRPAVMLLQPMDIK